MPECERSRRGRLGDFLNTPPLPIVVGVSIFWILAWFVFMVLILKRN